MNGSRLAGVTVVLVNNFPGPRLGGGEVQLLPVVEGLLAEGAGVTALVVPGSGFGARCGVLGARVVEAPMGLTGFGTAVAAVRLELQRVHATGGTPVLMGTGYLTNLIVRRAASHDVPVINQVAVVPGASTADGGSRFAEALRRVADRSSWARVHRFVAVSAAVADALGRAGVPADRIEVVPNGIDARKLAADADASGVPAAWPDGPVVACVARLEPVKGVETFVRSAAHVEGATFVVAGTGSQESRLREIATAQRGGSPVRFLGDVPSAAAVLRAADVVVVPSRSEAFGLVAAEAMALGTPVVASRVGGLVEVVGEAGVLVEPGDSGGLADAVRGFLVDRTRAQALGRAGRERAEGFSAAAMVEGYVRVIAQAARERLS